MEETRLFMEWVSSKKNYSFDSIGKFWFHTKTLKKITWREMWGKFMNSNE